MTVDFPEELTPDLTAILGRPNFECGRLADLLRKRGRAIDEKAEVEQAVVIHWFLKTYFAYPDDWRKRISDEVQGMLAQEPIETAK